MGKKEEEEEEEEFDISVFDLSVFDCTSTSIQYWYFNTSKQCYIMAASVYDFNVCTNVDAHGRCLNTIRECAPKADCRRKIPFPIGNGTRARIASCLSAHALPTEPRQ